MGLEHKTILVTRRPEQAAEMIDEIRAKGGTPVLLPMIEVLPPESWAECDHAIDRIDRYDAVVFTSTNAVHNFLGRASERPEGFSVLKGLMLIAVGGKTREELERRGLSVTFVPDTFSGQALGTSLSAAGIAGKRFLLPRGSLSGEELPRMLRAQGAEVNTVVVYRTAEPELRAFDTAAELLRSGGIDVITFASPSAARNFASRFPSGSIPGLHAHTKIAVIGPTTKREAERLGFSPEIVADESTAAGLIRAIDEYFD